ncbi:sphingomyelin phosphodiesterase [Vibrio azureus]|nr:sphingomyelin phosphodiesterase [Vibrio azureus]
MIVKYFVILFSVLMQFQVNASSTTDVPRLMNYNVYMLERILSPVVGKTNPDKRANLIAKSSIFDNTDVVVFNEVFDNQASEILLDGLSDKFKYRTPVLGRTQEGWDKTEGWRTMAADDGGVVILSKYPIEYQAQVIFGSSCGADKASQKGFIHTVINKGGELYNIIGTHVQADDSLCTVSPEVIRSEQFKDIQSYVARSGRSKDEMVFIAGDLNVAKQSSEFQSMLDDLNVVEPTNYAGAPYSWDPAANGFTNDSYPGFQGQLLDYILVERSHKQPENWHNQILDPISERVEVSGSQESFYFYEYSDHFPVVAFDYANEQTQTQSSRPINKPYNSIKLKHQSTGQYVYADANRDNGWLGYGMDGSVTNATFKLDNWRPYNGFCIRDNDYVQISRMDNYKDYYWTWQGNSYYTRFDNSADFMRISRKHQSDDCIQNGDVVFLYDHSHFITQSEDKYLEPHDSYIQTLSELPVSDNGLFIIEMPEFEYSDWKSNLTYN